jgi:hypothetical protein
MQLSKEDYIRACGRRSHVVAAERLRFAGLFRAGVLLIGLLTLPSEVYSDSKPRVLYQSVGLSPGTHYSRPLGIFYDRNRKECYVADTGNNQIVVCDESGTAF